jgi:hypothetical protein
MSGNRPGGATEAVVIEPDVMVMSGGFRAAVRGQGSSEKRATEREAAAAIPTAAHRRDA